MNRIAVIPARGGSKRIPRKNLKPFAGQPILFWSVQAAQKSGLFDRIIVSTDDDEITELARAVGAEVPFRRPAELSNDHAGTTEVVAHATRWALDSGIPVDAVCAIYATAPFVTADDLRAAHALLVGGAWDFVFPAVRFSYPVQRGLLRDDGGSIAMLQPEHFGTRSQDLPPVFHDAGQFYWGRTDAWCAQRRIFGSASTFLELPPWRVQDIDTPEDWEMAEILFDVAMRRAASTPQ